jgi:hypothetical protein
MALPLAVPPCSPEDTYSWIPGAVACLRCVEGIPQACEGGVCPSDPVVEGEPNSSPGELWGWAGLQAALGCWSGVVVGVACELPV